MVENQIVGQFCDGQFEPLAASAVVCRTHGVWTRKNIRSNAERLICRFETTWSFPLRMMPALCRFHFFSRGGCQPPRDLALLMASHCTVYSRLNGRLSQQTSPHHQRCLKYVRHKILCLTVLTSETRNFAIRRQGRQLPSPGLSVQRFHQPQARVQIRARGKPLPFVCFVCVSMGPPYSCH